MKIKRLYKLMIVIGLSFSGINAQKTKAELTFSDGSTKIGLAKLSGSESVKFRYTKKSKAIKYHFSELRQAKIFDGKESSTYVFVKIKGKKEPRVLKRIENGKVSLYTLLTQGYNPGMAGGTPGSGSVYMPGNFYNIKNLYVKRAHEQEAFHLGSNQLFTKNFKKAAIGFFKDCRELVKKIENKEFKKRDLKDIVVFYNENCE